jgi:hypothetical protein
LLMRVLFGCECSEQANVSEKWPSLQSGIVDVTI